MADEAPCLVAVGDSITQAEPPWLSWRYYLWQSLLDAGMNARWVGSMSARYTEGVMPNMTYNGAIFPQRHEGHWGWRADAVLRHLPTWAAAYACQPQCALVHLGTNDVCQGQDAASTINEISQIANTLRSLGDEQMTLLLAVPIPSCCDRVASILVPAIRALGGNGSRVIVDMASGFDASAMLYDGCHPNEAGERHIAAAWRASVLHHCAGNGTYPPPSVASHIPLVAAIVGPVGILLLLCVMIFCGPGSNERKARLRNRFCCRRTGEADVAASASVTVPTEGGSD